MHIEPLDGRAGRQAHVGDGALQRGAAVGGRVGGVGHAPADREGLRGICAPGDLRLQRAAIDDNFLVEDGVVVAVQILPLCNRAIPHGAPGRPGASCDPLNGRIIGRDKAGARTHFDGEIAQGQPALDGQGARGVSGEFDEMTAAAGDADFGDDFQRDVLARRPRTDDAIKADAHALRLEHGDDLRRQNVLKLGGAATEGERAEAADRAGVAVGHGVGRAGQHHADLGRDDMGNAVLVVAEIEDAHAIATAALAHGGDEFDHLAVGVAIRASGPRRRGVIEGGKGEIGPPHGAIGRGELLERVRRVQFMQHMAIDIDEIAPVDASGDDMGVPNLVDKRRRHGIPALLAARRAFR